MGYENCQGTYHVDTTCIECYGIISATPWQMKDLINTCHNLRYKDNVYSSVTN